MGYAKGDAVEVVAGPYAWFRGLVAGRVDGADDLVAVVLDVYDIRVPLILPVDHLGPDEGDGGVREPVTPHGPTNHHAASIGPSRPQRESS